MDLINKICVRVSVRINEEIITQGSGIIFYNSNSYFVLSAHHCIYAENNDFKVMENDVWVEHQEEHYLSPFNRIMVTEIVGSNSKEDWVLLRIDDPEFKIDFSKIVLGIPSQLGIKLRFSGYQLANPKSFRPFESKLLSIAPKQFKISLSGATFSSSSEEGAFIARGLSGSGVGVQVDDNLYLIGILKSVIGNEAIHDDIECCSISCLDDILKIRGINIPRVNINDVSSVYLSNFSVIKNNPYKGLAAFTIDDGDYFFGRDDELKRLLKLFIAKHNKGMISVIGDSGTGKSSFIQAGLLFQLKSKKELGFSEHRIVIVEPGNEPFTNLKYKLKLQGITLQDLDNSFDSTNKIIIYFDQFEELISQCHSEEAINERTKLLELLDSLFYIDWNSRIIVITSFRSDYLSKMANFGVVKNRAIIFPLNSLDYKVHSKNWEQSIKEIITQPAIKNGVSLELELVTSILEDIKEVEGSLPILQFTLQQIWTDDNIANGRISSSDFNKLTQGKGIGGILETHAESVFNRITAKGKDKEKASILKSIFVNLIEVNENQNDIKRTVRKDDIYEILSVYSSESVHEIFEDLVSKDSRLLSMSDEKEFVDVNIIHEELIRKWERLKGWVNVRREAKKRQKRILLDVDAFVIGEGELYNSKQLGRAEQWKKSNADLVNNKINSFLKMSRVKIRRRLRIIAAFFSTIGFMCLLVLIILVPHLKKNTLYKIIEDRYAVLNNYVSVAGGIDFVKYLSIDANGPDYTFLLENIEYFEELKRLDISYSNFKDLKFIQKIRNPKIVESLIISTNQELLSLIGIENLESLNSLVLENNYNLSSIEGIERLESINSLVLESNRNLVNLGGIENLQSLNSLIILDSKFTSLAGIENLRSLDSLVIESNFYINSLAGIENLESLKFLDIDDLLGSISLAGIEKLESLSSLTLSYIDSLPSLARIGNLESLNSLIIESADNLISLAGIENLESLNSLILMDNDSLTSLAGIENLESLNSLVLEDNDKLTSISGIENLQSLNSLIIQNSKFTSLASIENLESLDSLTISYCDSLTSLAGIESLESLNSLVIRGNYSLDSLVDIENLQTVNSLVIEDNSDLTSLEGIEIFESLNSLTISYCDSLASLEGIENLQSLKSLVIKNSASITTLRGIENLESLNALTISYNASLTSLAGIEKLQSLKSLVVKGNLILDSLMGFENIHSLTSLTISGSFDDFTDLSKIQKLHFLSSLTLYGCDRLTSLTGIENLVSLNSLTVESCDKLIKLEGMQRLESLKELVFLNSNSIAPSIFYQLEHLETLVLPENIAIDLKSIKKNNPEVRIVFLGEIMELGYPFIGKPSHYSRGN